MQRMYSNSGFTIVELIVVMTVAGILAGLLFGPLDNLYTSNVTSTKQVIQTGDIKGALRTIESDVAYATGFLTTPTIIDPTGTAWNSTTNYGSDNNNSVLITSNYATTAETSQSNPTRNLVFDPNVPTSTLKNNTVYFVKSGILYRRLIKNLNSASIAQKQTCSVGYTNPNCQVPDAVILRNVTSFAVTYYAGSPAVPQSTAAGATAVNVALKVSAGAGSNAYSATSSLKITPVNIGANP